MPSELIRFPVRLGLRAAALAVRSGLQVSERAIAAASFVVTTATSGASRDQPEASSGASRDQPEATSGAASRDQPEAYAPATQQPAPVPAQRAVDTTPQPPIPREPVAPPVSPPQTEPAHISEEPTLVEEFAEPGAEHGAGAQVTIAEPWDGYARMNAKDVIARVSDANAVELAAVQLYEAAHRSRETVMTAVARELRTKSGRGAATTDQPRKEHTNGG